MAQTTTSNIYSSWALDIFIEKVAIAQFEANNYFMWLWERKMLPKWTNSYKFNIVDAASIPASWVLTEWTVPTSTWFSMAQVEVTMTQLWAYTEFSDIALSDSPVDVIEAAWTELWRQIAEYADAYIQDQIDAWTNVVYWWDATSRATVDASDVITAADLAEVFSKLKWNKAPTFDWNWYVAVLHPYVVKDLFDDTAAWSFIEVNKYANPEAIFKWEIWKLFWIRIVESANVQAYVDAWAWSTVDVYPTFVMWSKAYWVVTAENMVMSVKLPWSAWTADPLDQKWTVWAKLRFWASILKEDALFRIESASSIWANA